jgi:TonB family protein
MKPKVLFPLICALFYFTQSVAQNQNVFYFKNSGTKVSVRDSADFTREIKVPDSGSVFFNVVETYINGKPKLLGKASRIEPLMLEGECTRYYPSGKKQQTATYKQNRLTGDVYDYYPNGELYLHKQFLSEKTPEGGISHKELVIACNDSTGKPLVTGGNGYYTGYKLGYNGDRYKVNEHNAYNFKEVIEEGNIKSGLKDGNWKGVSGDKDDKLTFSEVYDNGKFISGRSVDANNKIYDYTIREAEPVFAGGIQAFYAYLTHNIRYPVDSRTHYIQGKVLATFIVEKDGSVTNIKVLRAPAEDLGAEAVRVLQESPNWIPGTQNGKPVRVQYTVPISFTLHSNW